MPVNPVGRCIAVELISDINEVLNGCNVDIVDRRKIKDDGLERGAIGMVDWRFAASRTRVVPRTILWAKLIHIRLDKRHCAADHLPQVSHKLVDLFDASL